MEPESRIIEGATELFYRFGIRSITMDDVARHLAMSKKTLYHHFHDKNDMVMKCCRHDLSVRECTLHKIAQDAADAIGELFMLMKNMEAMFSRMNPNLVYDMQKYHPDVWKMFMDFKDQNIMDMIETNLRKGIGQGLYRSDIDIPVMARLRLEEVTMGMNPGVFPPAKFNFAGVQMALLDHFMHGITTLRGHRLINKYKQISEEE